MIVTFVAKRFDLYPSASFAIAKGLRSMLQEHEEELTLLGASAVAKPLAEYVVDKNPVRTPLLPSAGLKGAKFDNRWLVFVNAEVEAEV
ncbi:MAG: hypothetical protein GX751_12200 [Desulfuromonadaceae bacterium]|nr:hypothetical protein [Desulfuromonadaceae bacterium]